MKCTVDSPNDKPVGTPQGAIGHVIFARGLTLPMAHSKVHADFLPIQWGV